MKRNRSNQPPRQDRPAPFRHTPRELGVLNRAHASMMQHLNTGHRYDVAKLAWVDADGNVVSP